MKKLLCFCLIILLTFSACQKSRGEQKYTDYSFDYFDTVTTIVGFEQDEDKFKQNCKLIKEQLGQYHKLYNIYNRYDGVNNLCLLNSVTDGAHPKLTVDQRIIDLLLYAKEMYALTDGKTNVAMGSVLSLWHQYREEGLNDPASAKLPPMDKLQKAAEHTDIQNVVIDEKTSSVHLSDPLMKLDVGAIAKGFAAEKIALWMEKNGMNDYILNIGGNVRALGARPDGKKWSIGIENPDTEDDETPYIEYLEFERMSLVTSGSYQRFYMVEDQKYHHIIDPQTLLPATYFQSVSVLCLDSGKADALSTALFCMDYAQGRALIDGIKDCEAMWVLPDGSKQYSNGFKNYCTDE